MNPSDSSATFFDSHCHLDAKVFGDELDLIIGRARQAGVTHMTTIGSDDSVAYARQAVTLAEKDPNIYATVGIHPHNAKNCDDSVFNEIAHMAALPAVVAIGETGLDYHYDLSPRSVQQQVFRRFIQLSHDTEKPLVIHVRNAFDDCLRILDEAGGRDLRVVIHCFTGTKDEAARCLERGFWLSIPGIVTFKKAGDIPEVAAHTPLDRLMVETDCPYLAPAPFRGKRNEPAFVVHTAKKVAELRGLDVADIAAATTANAKHFYGLP